MATPTPPPPPPPPPPQGCLTVYDVDTSSQVFSLPGLGTLSSVSLASRGHSTVLAAAHCQIATQSEIMLMVLGGGDGERRRIPVAAGCKVRAVVYTVCDVDECVVGVWSSSRSPRCL